MNGTKTSGTYVATVECPNCGHREVRTIPKGQRIDKQICSNCGCGPVGKGRWA